MRFSTLNICTAHESEPQISQGSQKYLEPHEQGLVIVQQRLCAQALPAAVAQLRQQLVPGSPRALLHHRLQSLSGLGGVEDGAAVQRTTVTRGFAQGRMHLDNAKSRVSWLENCASKGDEEAEC